MALGSYEFGGVPLAYQAGRQDAQVPEACSVEKTLAFSSASRVVGGSCRVPEDGAIRMGLSIDCQGFGN